MGGQSERFVWLRSFVVSVALTLVWVGGPVIASRFGGTMSLPMWLCAIGFALAAAGGILCLACVTVFAVRGRGTPAPFDPPRAFVVTGPYRYVRNPMLLGFCVMLFGLGMGLDSLAALGFAVFALLCGHLMVVLWEERHLRARFGQPYVAYCARVPRWIPRL